MGFLDSLFGKQTQDKPVAELLADEALLQLSHGNDGDEVYHPLYKAWRAIQANPASLKDVNNPGKLGSGLSVFLSFGTVSDVDDRQQVISLAYLLLSEAIEQNPNDLNLIKNRVISMLQDKEALQYTVSSAIEPNTDIFSLTLSPFGSRDGLLKMIYSDLSKSPKLSQNPAFQSTFFDLENKINNGFFGRSETKSSIISEGQKNHSTLLSFLKEKVYKNQDIDF